MSDSVDSTLTFRLRPTKCPHCGQYCSPDAEVCGKCGKALAGPLPALTIPLDRTPRAISTAVRGEVEFLNEYQAVLQVLPSGVCLQLPLNQPITLGRAANVGPMPDLLDLQTFNANQHGISRRHCQLMRQDQRLIVTDLGSTNGTYLNNKRLKAEIGCIAAHGDRLILGTLHLIIFFSPLISD